MLAPPVPLLLAILSAIAASGSRVSVAEHELNDDLEAYYKSKENPIEDCQGAKYSQRLNLSHTEIYKLPSEFLQSTGVSGVSLAGNRLASVTDSVFAGLPNLRCLNLASNRLNLQEINANKSLHLLETLILNNQDGRGQITYSPQINLPYLKRLELAGNRVAAITEGFATAFPSLVHLDLSRNSVSRASSVRNLPMTLRHLELRSNSLDLNDFEPTSVFPNVSALYLDGNRRSIIQRLGWSYTAENLRVLSLSDCYIGSVTKNLGTWNLTALDLSDNSIKVIDEDALSVTLRRLSLSHNYLSDFPICPKLTSLTTLYLSHNNIAILKPKWIQTLTSLETLSLKANGILQIEPDTFDASTNLRQLDLSENKLSVLPRNWMRSLVQLRYLNLNANKFALIEDISIERSVPLVHLFFRNNVTDVSLEILAGLPKDVTLFI